MPDDYKVVRENGSNGSNPTVDLVPTRHPSWDLSPREPHLYDYLLILRGEALIVPRAHAAEDPRGLSGAQQLPRLQRDRGRRRDVRVVSIGKRRIRPQSPSRIVESLGEDPQVFANRECLDLR